MHYVIMEWLYADSGRPCPAVSALQRSKATTGLHGKAVGRSRLAAFLELLLVQVRVKLTCARAVHAYNVRMEWLHAESRRPCPAVSALSLKPATVRLN